MNKKTILLSFVFGVMGFKVFASERHALERLFKQCPEYRLSIGDKYTMALAVSKKEEVNRCPALADLRVSPYYKCLGREMATIEGLDIYRGVLPPTSIRAILEINESIKKCREISSL